MKINDQMMALEKRTKKNMKNEMSILQTIFFVVVVVVIFWYMFLSWKTAAVAEALLVVFNGRKEASKSVRWTVHHAWHRFDFILLRFMVVK